jgi:cellulase
MKFSTPVLLAAAASSASAHTIFVSLNDGAVGDGVRVPSYDGVCPSPPGPSIPLPPLSLQVPNAPTIRSNRNPH